MQNIRIPGLPEAKPEQDIMPVPKSAQGNDPRIVQVNLSHYYKERGILPVPQTYFKARLLDYGKSAGGIEWVEIEVLNKPKGMEAKQRIIARKVKRTDLERAKMALQLDRQRIALAS